jgi:hypothetical protein
LIRGSRTSSVGTITSGVSPAAWRIPPLCVKKAAEYLASTRGATLQEAAKHVGWSTWRLREALKKPHNLQHARAVKALAVEALAVSGPATLAKVIADWSNQMAVVAAVKTVESLRQVAAADAGLSAPGVRLPGLQVVIIQRDGAVMQTSRAR